MLEGQKLKEAIGNLVAEYVMNYQEEKGIPKLWRTPLVGFADAYDPYIQNLKNIVSDRHKLPQDFMENPKVVITYFIPFTKELAGTNVNVEENKASEEWGSAYNITNKMIGELNEYLAAELVKMGYRAHVTEGVTMYYDILKSNWSQRHLAYASGLGTFGINNLLITKEGCCGRYGSIVADIPVEPEYALKEENCLYKSKGLCKKCVENCFSGALTVDGFDRVKCKEACSKNAERVDAEVCGKCATNIPCAFTAP